MGEGDGEVRPPLRLPRHRRRLLARRSRTYYWYALAAFCVGIALNAVYGVVQLLLAETTGANLDEILVQPLTSRETAINVFGAVQGSEVFRPNALTGDPNHLGIELVVPLLVLTPLYLRLERGHRLKTPLAVLLGFLLVVELATLSRSGLLGLACGALVLALPYRRHLRTRAFLVPFGAVLALVGAVVLARLDFFLTVLRARTNTSYAASSPHFGVYEFIPDVLSTNPLLGLGLNNFAVYYEFVTGRPDFGPHSFYVALLVETGLVGNGALRRVRVLDLPAPGRGAPGRRALAAAATPRVPRAPARLGDDRGARRHARREPLLPDHDLLLLLRLRGARGAVLVVFGAGRDAMRSSRSTTSYPRGRDDVAGVFVRDAVEHLRGAGVEVDVVSPASFRHFGLAYGHGIVGNLRPAALARAGHPLVPALVRTGGARGAAAAPISCTRTGSRPRCRRSRREALRRPALGHGRRAGTARALGRSLAPPARTARLCVVAGPRRRGPGPRGA